MAVAIVLSILISIVTGWHKEAEKAMRREEASLVIVLVAACLLIVVFIIIFSARHRWDMNEQQYRELLDKEDKP